MGGNELTRPTSLALMAIAAVGWLVAVYFWSDGVSLRAENEEATRRAEVARQGLITQLQGLQESSGSAADLGARLESGRKALDETVARSTEAATRLEELTRKINEAELTLAARADLVEQQTALLKDTAANLKTTQDELADIAAQKSSAAAELAKAEADLAAVRAARAQLDATDKSAKP